MERIQIQIDPENLEASVHDELRTRRLVEWHNGELVVLGRDDSGQPVIDKELDIKIDIQSALATTEELVVICGPKNEPLLGMEESIADFLRRFRPGFAARSKTSRKVCGFFGTEEAMISEVCRMNKDAAREGRSERYARVYRN